MCDLRGKKVFSFFPQLVSFPAPFPPPLFKRSINLSLLGLLQQRLASRPALPSNSSSASQTAPLSKKKIAPDLSTRVRQREGERESEQKRKAAEPAIGEIEERRGKNLTSEIRRRLVGWFDGGSSCSLLTGHLLCKPLWLKRLPLSLSLSLLHPREVCRCCIFLCVFFKEPDRLFRPAFQVTDPPLQSLLNLLERVLRGCERSGEE